MKQTKQFNKVKLLSDLGLLNCKFDYASLRFQPSALLRLKASLILFVVTSFPLKFYFSTLFDREALIQLKIGNPFNYLPDLPRQLLGYVGLVEASWMISIHLTFNSTRGRRLLLQWMKLTYELPATRCEGGHEVVGLSRKQNRKFWLAERRFNWLWYRWMAFLTLASCSIFSVQFFLVPFDVNIFVYAFFQAINIVHFYIYFFLYANVIYTLNVFLLTLIRYFSKKFCWVASRTERLLDSNRLNNRKLTRLLAEYNAIHLELFAMRDLFKRFIGQNLSFYFVMALLATFACLFSDLRMAVGVLITIYFLGLATIFPFYFATSVIDQNDRAKHRLETISFRKSTKLAVKLKIDSLSNLGDQIGFFCFDWFRIGSFNGVLILLEFAVYLLLLLEGYYLVRLRF